jgi:tetratricopeptide (TPR) repeat protein
LRALSRAQLALGDLAQARSTARRAERAEPHHADGNRLLGQLALASGDAPRALAILQAAVRSSPRDPLAHCELGELQLKIGNPTAAGKAFESALRIDRNHVRARLGMVHAAIPAGARQFLKESETLVAETTRHEPPVRARALALNARVYLSLKSLDAAKARAEEAVAALESSADAHYALALVAQHRQDPDAAVGELGRVLSLDPSLAEAHLALALSLGAKKEHSRATSEIDAYLHLAPSGKDAAAARKLRARFAAQGR